MTATIIVIVIMMIMIIIPIILIILMKTNKNRASVFPDLSLHEYAQMSKIKEYVPL